MVSPSKRAGIDHGLRNWLSYVVLFCMVDSGKSCLQGIGCETARAAASVVPTWMERVRRRDSRGAGVCDPVSESSDLEWDRHQCDDACSGVVRVVRRCGVGDAGGAAGEADEARRVPRVRV
jgi:hypothetical protein